jgi:hypothetical protein
MKKILLTETELSVIGMVFQDEDWAAYLSILKYLKAKQYICEE